MLDAKDLRIENLFKLNNPHYRPKENGSIVSVTSIDTNRNEMNEDCVYEPKVAVGLLVVDNNKFYENRFAQWIEYLEPIPLTEEWLLIFGFEVDDDLGDQIYYQIPNQKNGYGICFDHDDIAFYKFYGNGGENVHTLIHDEEHLQYVHQLQNIYYALTQTELTLKEIPANND